MIEKEPKSLPQFEREIKPENIGIATALMYKNWYSGEMRDLKDTDKLRGDLALQTLQAAREKGYQVVVIDGGSSLEFQSELGKIGYTVEPETERGMSGSRRQALHSIASIDQIKILVWTEPEKISFVQNGIQEAIKPLLEGKAHIVVPTRMMDGWDTYPKFQKKWEKRANRAFNRLIRSQGLAPIGRGRPYIDVCFGPRVMVNDPAILDLFSRIYEFDTKTGYFNEEFAIGKYKINPEDWADALILPILNAMEEGYKVARQQTLYEHPKLQTQSESDSPVFQDKRKKQFHSIMTSAVHLVNQGKRKSRLSLKIPQGA